VLITNVVIYKLKIIFTLTFSNYLINFKDFFLFFHLLFMFSYFFIVVFFIIFISFVSISHFYCFELLKVFNYCFSLKFMNSNDFFICIR